MYTAFMTYVNIIDITYIDEYILLLVLIDIFQTYRKKNMLSTSTPSTKITQTNQSRKTRFFFLTNECYPGK